MSDKSDAEKKSIGYASNFEMAMREAMSEVDGMVDEINSLYGEGEGTGASGLDVAQEATQMRSAIADAKSQLDEALRKIDDAFRTRKSAAKTGAYNLYR